MWGRFRCCRGWSLLTTTATTKGNGLLAQQIPRMAMSRPLLPRRFVESRSFANGWASLEQGENDSSASPQNSSTIPQPIVGYHLDEEGHWVAELACGHAQHVRHDPPWMERPWVLTEKGRNSFLGYKLSCKHCGTKQETP
uniref:DUF3565 domain-containing protein n=1 Tax=Entomoneis paludosa TaxID=265537 RepID=A0A6U3B6V0_9STRA|mmetsp:Transcript_29314/g.61332  ORF Transcript_29314/g.61332 Transcript_29314/m.61332 type:complete len:140 (+) Transcript_29314:1-420(+)